MKRKILFTVPALCLLTFLAEPHPPSSVAASPSEEKRAIATIDFFGHGQLDVVKLLSVLPIQTGESNNADSCSGACTVANVSLLTGHRFNGVRTLDLLAAKVRSCQRS